MRRVWAGSNVVAARAGAPGAAVRMAPSAMARAAAASVRGRVRSRLIATLFTMLPPSRCLPSPNGPALVWKGGRVGEASGVRAGDLRQGRAQPVELGRIHPAREVALDSAEVDRADLAEPLQSVIRQVRERASAIRRAFAALDEPGGLESVDATGHATPAEHHAISQVAHSQGAARTREGHQHVVIGDRHAGLRLEFRAEASNNRCVRLQERRPGRKRRFVLSRWRVACLPATGNFWSSGYFGHLLAVRRGQDPGRACVRPGAAYHR